MPIKISKDFSLNSITKLRCIQTNIGRPLHTSTLQPKYLMKALIVNNIFTNKTLKI